MHGQPLDRRFGGASRAAQVQLSASARIRPGTVNSGAVTSTRSPSERAVSAVTGPMQATRGMDSKGAASAQKEIAEMFDRTARGEGHDVDAVARF